MGYLCAGGVVFVVCYNVVSLLPLGDAVGINNRLRVAIESGDKTESLKALATELVDVFLEAKAAALDGGDVYKATQAAGVLSNVIKSLPDPPGGDGDGSEGGGLLDELAARRADRGSA